MKVTFPHLGSMHIIFKAIEETAGIPYIVPPETSRKTLILCVLHSNEYGLWMGTLRTRLRGFDLPRKSCSARRFECGECGDQCEMIELLVDQQVVACRGGLCERYGQGL